MSKEKRYIQFPLSLLREFHTQKVVCINKIFAYGIGNYAQSLIERNYTSQTVINHIIYSNYNSKLPDELKAMLSGLEYFGSDEDYKGFNGEGKLEPYEDEYEELETFFSKNKEASLIAGQFYRMHLAKKYLLTPKQIEKLDFNDDQILEGYHLVSNNTKEDSCFPMVNVDTLLEYLENDKSESETMQLLAFIGIKSIIGQKQYTKTNYAHVMARAFGYNSTKDVPKELPQQIQPIFDKYQIRYHRDTLFTSLEDNWNLIKYGFYLRGFYVSVDSKFSLEKLVLVAESSKKKNKDTKRKNDKAEARKKALEKLGI